MDLNQITLASTNVPRSVDFYTRLGLKVIVNSAPRYVRLLCPDGRTTLSIHHGEDATASAVVTLYFECEELDRTVTDLEQRGIVFTSRPTDQPWLWREAGLRDPDGHHLILYHAGENRLDPPWKVR